MNKIKEKKISEIRLIFSVVFFEANLGVQSGVSQVELSFFQCKRRIFEADLLLTVQLLQSCLSCYKTQNNLGNG